MLVWNRLSVTGLCFFWPGSDNEVVCGYSRLLSGGCDFKPPREGLKSQPPDGRRLYPQDNNEAPRSISCECNYFVISADHTGRRRLLWEHAQVSNNNNDNDENNNNNNNK